MEILEELIAEREIRKLLALYPQYVDDNKTDEWALLFAEDGALVAGPHRMQGHAALREWLTNVQRGPKMRHLMMNADISIESPTSARSTMDMALLRAEGSQWMLMAAPRYTDRIVKTASGWKFAERIIDARAL